MGTNATRKRLNRNSVSLVTAINRITDNDVYQFEQREADYVYALRLLNFINNDLAQLAPRLYAETIAKFQL